MTEASCCCCLDLRLLHGMSSFPLSRKDGGWFSFPICTPSHRIAATSCITSNRQVSRRTCFTLSRHVGKGLPVQHRPRAADQSPIRAQMTRSSRGPAITTLLSDAINTYSPFSPNTLHSAQQRLLEAYSRLTKDNNRAQCKDHYQRSLSLLNAGTMVLRPPSDVSIWRSDHHRVSEATAAEIVCPPRDKQQSHMLLLGRYHITRGLPAGLGRERSYTRANLIEPAGHGIQRAHTHTHTLIKAKRGKGSLNCNHKLARH